MLACLNGAGQSAGWPGLVKTMASWFRHRERGVVMAWWTTNYVIGGFVGTIFATFVVTSRWLFPSWGWHRGFWVPAMALCVVAAVFFTLVRNRPSDAGLPEIVAREDEFRDAPAGLSGEHPFLETARTYLRMLGDPEVWTVAVGALFSKVTRYSFCSGCRFI
jgi:sugar phosphate permease